VEGIYGGWSLLSSFCIIMYSFAHKEKILLCTSVGLFDQQAVIFCL
jgi:hypothetical protein